MRFRSQTFNYLFLEVIIDLLIFAVSMALLTTKAGG
jgi:hypothetical protein